MEHTQVWPSDETLRAIAPDTFGNFRQNRYIGDDLSIELADLAPDDQQTARLLYERLNTLLALTISDESNARFGAIRAFRESPEWIELVARIRMFGVASMKQHPHPMLAQVAHDIRGGAMTALLLLLGQVRPDVSADQIHRIFLLTRDQCKILRSCVRDLDLDARARDRARKLHSVALCIEKWSRATDSTGDSNSSGVTVDCRYECNLAECCLEFSALDRVLYNLLNNAIRHAVDGAARLVIVGTPQESPMHVRFMVINRVASSHRHTLQERFQDDLRELFYGGFTTGGAGLGMRICADVIANAYGVRTIDRCLADGYLGAKLVDDAFIAWVHWPIAAD